MSMPIFGVERLKASKLQQLSDAAARAGVTLRRVANQSIPDNSATSVSWDTEDVDTDGFFVIGSPTIVTIPTGLAGSYAVVFTGTASGATTAASFVQLNASTSVGHVAYRDVYPSGHTFFSLSVPMLLAAGDFFNIQLTLDTSAGVNFTGRLTCYRVAV